MKSVAQWFIIAVLAGVYLLALFAVLHPMVSPAYRAYYIDHTSLEWNPAHYPVTPEQGMNFSREGLPVWVNTTYGLSFREPWGRWTDADAAKVPGLSLTRSFNGPFCLVLTARPARSMFGQTLAVQMGSETRTVRIVSQDFADYEIPFTEVREADSINFLFPEKVPRESEVERGSADTRRLGLGLAALRILPGGCAGSSR
jgi:hypothetical protein